MKLRIILAMLIPLIESQGRSMEADSDPTNDLIGEGLVFIGHFAQYLADKANGKDVTPPAIPAGLQ